MDFNAQQMREDCLIKEGRYKFTVLDAREKRSDGGNDMINLKLSLDVDGRKLIHWDTLLFMPKMFWKVEHFCKAAGMFEKIAQGRLTPDDCFGRTGYVDIIQKPDNKTGELGNQVKDYVKPEEAEAEKAFEDDIAL